MPTLLNWEKHPYQSKLESGFNPRFNSNIGGLTYENKQRYEAIARRELLEKINLNKWLYRQEPMYRPRRKGDWQ